LFQPAAEAAGLARSRPYDLRHSFVSLLLWEGVSPPQVAQQAGHGLDMTYRTYGHVIDELEEAGERRSAEEEIRRARVAPVPHLYPDEGRERKGSPAGGTCAWWRVVRCHSVATCGGIWRFASSDRACG
jgi:hypothetical protein